MTEQGSEEYAPLCLREAAEQAGTSKRTIWRAIRAGRMSATPTDDGGFAIELAELFRAFPRNRNERRGRAERLLTDQRGGAWSWGSGKRRREQRWWRRLQWGWRRFVPVQPCVEPGPFQRH